MSTAISQKEYLKKYLGGGRKEEKKKKKKVKISSSKILKKSVIVDDDDLGLNQNANVDDDVFNLEYMGEDAPQIVGVVDERPLEVKAKELYSDSTKWKSIGEASDEPSQPPRDNGSVGEASSPKEKASGRKYDSDEVTGRASSSAVRKKDRRQSDSDQSPPRKKTSCKKTSRNSDSDQSPPRKKDRHRNHKASDSDQSPPRRKDRSKNPSRTRASDSDQSPPRRKDRSKNPSRARASDSDQSPPRRKPHRDSDSDQSPPRKHSAQNKSRDRTDSRSFKKDSGYKSSRRRERGRDSDSDLSPPRKSQVKSRKPRANSDSDLSPPRKSTQKASTSDFRKDEKTLDGKKAGLQDAKNLRSELTSLREEEDRLFKKLNKELVGVGSAPIRRDRRTGAIADEQKEQEEAAKKAAKDAERNAKYSRWGRGLKQVEESEQMLADMSKEMNKPMARYADDQDLDSFLKAQPRDGDPMLDYIQRKQAEATKIDLPKLRPRYEGAFMPNRFGIRPGHKWDGVDRSNGYEKRWFDEQSRRKAGEEEAYKWSIADM